VIKGNIRASRIQNFDSDNNWRVFGFRRGRKSVEALKCRICGGSMRAAGLKWDLWAGGVGFEFETVELVIRPKGVDMVIQDGLEIKRKK